MSDLPKSELLESIYKHATIGILASNKKGEIIMANQYAVDTFGYQEEKELLSLKIEDLIPKRFHKNHVQNRTGYLKNASTRGMGVGRDLYGKRKNGEEFPVEVSLSPFRSGEEMFVFAFIIDITIRKKIEESERNYQKQVTEILNSLRKEKELNDMQSDFISMASHEFKTPLTTILSSAALLSKYRTTDQQEKRDKHIERIQGSVRNINRILNDFLSMSKLEKENLNVRKSNFNLKEFISGLCEEFDSFLKQDQVIDYQHIGEEVVFLDPELLRNILTNLLTNASKFSGKNATIFIRSEVTAQHIYLKVKDTGMGISEKDQEHLFDRFYRGENAFITPGTGLGLHIVKTYVQVLRGKIQMNSKLGEGTEFIIKFAR